MDDMKWNGVLGTCEEALLVREIWNAVLNVGKIEEKFFWKWAIWLGCSGANG
jgi:hypothetical protein